METPAVHLARKWRVQTFNAVQGQDLVVRILQNNLYRGYFFPLYLFAGPRGSGKTSIARMFATALNCQSLSHFQQSPRETSVPCWECTSCTTALRNNHPDIIEIDAASYTGVDNIRSLIESASFLPVMGGKKVYIVDEAHMLSKAAFNAFLKILEEPPAGALFVLATTDPTKILDTVKSRSLQLFFQRVPEDTLARYLAYICDCEQISYTDDGVMRIAQAADGSVRDALQILERVFLAQDTITRDKTVATLGDLDEQAIIEILYVLATYSPYDAMQYIGNLQLEQYAPIRVWYRLVDALRSLMWGHYGNAPSVWEATSNFYPVLHRYSPEVLYRLLDVVYQYEAYLVKTTYTKPILDMMFFDMVNALQGDRQYILHEETGSQSSRETTETGNREHKDTEASAKETTESGQSSSAWERVVAQFEEEGDQLLASVVKQALDVTWSEQTLYLTFARELQFYYEWMEKYKSFLEELVERVYGVRPAITFVFKAVAQNTEDSNVKQKENSSSNEDKRERVKKSVKPRQQNSQKRSSVTYESISDIDNVEKWPLTHAVLQAFPGTVKRIKRK